MSGTKFVDALRRIGYPQAGELDADSFDWIFEYDGVLPFLDWFCDEIQASNRLDQKDLDEFKLLEQSQESTLEGEQLEDSLHTISSGEQLQLTDDDLRKEIAELEEDLNRCKQRKEVLIQQQNKLSAHKTAVGDKLSKFSQVENAAKASYKQKLERSQTDNNKMNASLDELLAAVTDLNTLYLHSKTNLDQNVMEQKQPVFLSQIPLENIFSKEEKFTSQLTAFTKKQFFEGIAEMAGQNEGSRYELLEISNPNSLLVAGEKESTVFDACKEIARIQLHNPKSESLYIDALVKEKCLATASEFLDQKYHQVKEKSYPKDISDLRYRLKDAQSTLGVLRRDLVRLAEEEVQGLIKDSATLQVTRILRGNYDLKIARQDYFMSNQEQVIDFLVVQRSRNELLTMAYELEAKDHRNTYRLLTAINMLLQKMYKSQTDRLEMLKDPALTNDRSQRSTLDSRDKFFTKVHKMLNPEGFQSQPQVFVTYSQLVENADRLHHQVTSLRASSSMASSSQDDTLKSLEKTLKKCESCVYSDSSTIGGHPTLSPQPIIDAMTQLDAMLKNLEQSVVDIMKDVDQKKKAIHSDSLLAAERELFLHFFNDPDRLRRIMAEVSQKLDARLAK